MVDFSAFAAEDGLPIYLQIIRHVKRAIAAGTVQAGDELPSRRVLSAQLGVNPNTVQKAYKLLEDEGIISSRSGAKSEIALSPKLVERAISLLAPEREEMIPSGAKSEIALSPKLVEQIRRQLLEQEAGLLVRALRQAGLEKEAALALLERLWEENEEEGL